MDGEIVANAATAGKALAEMAATMPNTGGLVSFFAGENDMTAFGKQLVPFGEAMETVRGCNYWTSMQNAVTEAAIAGKDHGRDGNNHSKFWWCRRFFAGENDMGEFGKQACTHLAKQ